MKHYQLPLFHFNSRPLFSPFLAVTSSAKPPKPATSRTIHRGSPCFWQSQKRNRHVSLMWIWLKLQRLCRTAFVEFSADDNDYFTLQQQILLFLLSLTCCHWRLHILFISLSSHYEFTSLSSVSPFYPIFLITKQLKSLAKSQVLLLSLTFCLSPFLHPLPLFRSSSSSFRLPSNSHEEHFMTMKFRGMFRPPRILCFLIISNSRLWRWVDVKHTPSIHLTLTHVEESVTGWGSTKWGRMEWINDWVTSEQMFFNVEDETGIRWLMDVFSESLLLSGEYTCNAIEF